MNMDIRYSNIFLTTSVQVYTPPATPHLPLPHLLQQDICYVKVGLLRNWRQLFLRGTSSVFNPLSANPTKWSNTLKQFVGKLPTNCLSVFDHFVRLVVKGFSISIKNQAIKKYGQSLC